MSGVFLPGVNMLVGTYSWAQWFLLAGKLAVDAPLYGEPSALSWQPVPRSTGWVPPALRDRVADPQDPLSAYAEGHEFRLVVDFQEVAKLALDLDGPSERWQWAVLAIVRSAEYLCDGLPVLRQLVQLASEAKLSDPRTRALFVQHLRALCDKPGDRFVRWARSVGRAVEPIARDAVQLSPPGHSVVLRSGDLLSGERRVRCRVPRYPSSRRKPPADDPLAREAAWMLGCTTGRDGAVRDGGIIIVHVAAYLLVARLLERPYFGSQSIPLPSLSGKRAAWVEAACRWAELFTTATEGWLDSKFSPQVRAAALGWDIPRDMPALALNAERVEGLLGGRAAALSRLPLPARQQPSVRRGAPSHIKVPYGTRELHVTQRRIPGTTELRLYFELPFDPPAHMSVGKYQHFTLRGIRLWALPSIVRFAEARYYGAEEFARFAAELTSKLLGRGFHLEYSRQATVVRAQRAAVGGERMGGYSLFELDQLASVFDQRSPGPLPAGFWEELAVSFPGREAASLRRTARRLMETKARKSGWRVFRESGWWPGGELARSIFARVVKKPTPAKGLL